MKIQNKDLKNLPTLLNKNNTILLIHADWCIHCQLFKPVWEKTLKDLKNKLNIQFLSIENEVLRKLQESDIKLFNYITTTPSEKSVYFPKIMIISKTSKGGLKRKVYTGNRDYDEFTKYLVEKFSK